MSLGDTTPTIRPVSNYTVTADINTSTATPGGLVDLAFNAGTVTPKTELEAQVLADLALSGVVALAPEKQPKTKTPATEE